MVLLSLFELDNKNGFFSSNPFLSKSKKIYIVKMVYFDVLLEY